MSATEALIAHTARRRERAAQIKALQAAQRRDAEGAYGTVATLITEATGHRWRWCGGGRTAVYLLALLPGGWTATVTLRAERPEATLERGPERRKLGPFTTIEAAAREAIRVAQESS